MSLFERSVKDQAIGCGCPDDWGFARDLLSPKDDVVGGLAVGPSSLSDWVFRQALW